MSFSAIIASSRVRRQTETMHLSYAPTTELNLLIETQSGDDWEIDWGDGVWERYASSSSTYAAKTFGTATSGVARVRSATGRGLSDLHRVRATEGTWSFDVTALSGLTSLAYLNIRGQNTLTGDIANAPVGLDRLDIQGQNTLSGLIDNAPAGLTYLYITGQNTVSGLIDNAPVGLTYLYVTGQNTLTYTGKQWVENQDRHLFRATQFNSQMVDQYLIDLSAVTNWTGSKTVDLRVGVAPTSASASAIATLESRGVTVLTS